MTNARKRFAQFTERTDQIPDAEPDELWAHA
jgi:hypothetical protein